MRLFLACLGLVSISGGLAAQAPGRWPPDSLVNTKVIPRTTPVIQVIGTMRNIAGGLGVRCQYCHVGEEGMTLEQFDFASDEKRTKLIARQMMHMVQEINRRMGNGRLGWMRPTRRNCAPTRRPGPTIRPRRPGTGGLPHSG